MRRNTILLTINMLALLFSGYMVFIYAPKFSEKARERKMFNWQVDALLKDLGDAPDSQFIERMAEKVSTYENIECAYLGIEGRKSTQFNPVNSFVKLATDAQLVRFINNGNTIVQHYAFMALVRNNPDLSKKVMRGHINDRQTYNSFCGCTIEPWPINIDFFQAISFRLTPDKHILYKKQLQKQYKGTYFQMTLDYL